MVKGLVRTIDNLGRVVIPKEFRRSLGINDFEEMDIYLNGRTICINKMYTRCVCCGKPEKDTELMDYKGVLMCPECYPDTTQGGDAK